MRAMIFLLAMIFAAPLAAEDAPPVTKPAADKACQFYTHNCEHCGFEENGKIWCTTSFFGCRIVGFDCLLDADGTRHANG